MAAAVEGKKWHKENIRLNFRCFGRLADTPDAGGERLADRCAHDQRLTAFGNDGQRQPRALLRESRINGSGLISLPSGMKPETTIFGAITSGKGRATMISAAFWRASAGSASRAIASRRSAALVSFTSVDEVMPD